MIPLKLSLENFLCYGNNLPILDLQGVHLACLCGQNGHGKSALLDAITWVLWGRARSKSNEELIHYGRDDMWIELDFLARNNCYRVIRRYSLGKGRRRQGSSDLQLQITSSDELVSITGNTLRNTQSRIDNIIGMDYETFINSAFLLQGRADEFTNKSPGDRKEVLAKILELGAYDRLQDRAKHSADEHKLAATILEADLERMSMEVARTNSYSQDLQELEGQIFQVNHQLEGSRADYNTLKMQVDDLVRIDQELEDLKSVLPLYQRDILNLENQIKGARGRIETYESSIQRQDEIRSGLAQFRKFQEDYLKLNEASQRYDHLAKQKSDVEKQLADARARLEERIVQMRHRMELQLAPQVEEASQIEDQINEAREDVLLLEAEERSAAQEQLHLQEIASNVGHYQAVSEQLKAEGQELRSKLNLVSSAGEGSDCPLCGTTLEDEGCRHLAATYEKLIKEKLDHYRQGQGSLDQAEKEAQSLGEALPRRQQDISRRQQAAQNTLTRLQIKLTDCRAAATELEQLEITILQQVQELEQKLFAPDFHQKLADLQVEINALGYDQDLHRKLYLQLEEHRSFEESGRLLDEAEEHLPQELELVSTTVDILNLRKAALETALVRSAEIEASAANLGNLKVRLASVEDTVKSLEQRQEGMLRRQGELQGNLRKLQQMADDMEAKTTSLNDERDSQGIYQELAEAFGRRGIQAMLIETVLPKVEDEANALLDRMTDGRMHLKLESQRERRSGRGDPIETLEIIISDEIGPRSYELFSGGEAFRINLALRIALSKVLANRKGAPLPVLFIDEGFGTQDTGGRERILDVISSIQDDFEKIIVISHLDEIRDAFPVRIEVQKDGSGSSFWIS